jgi:hypothetical protein
MEQDKKSTDLHKEHIKYVEETKNLKSAEELAKEAKLTKEDKEALGPKDLSLDGGDDEQLLDRVDPVDFDGTGLDIPGRNLDDDQEDRGNEDEENNHYSLGSDDNDQLERGEL